MANNKMVRYWKFEFTVIPTKNDDVGCDGLYFSDSEDITEKIKSLPEKIKSMETQHEVSRGLVRIADVVRVLKEIEK